MREVLLSAKRALDKIDLTFWLEAGTCLGAIRNNDFIYTQPDIDLGVYEEDVESLDAIYLAFHEEGFCTPRVLGTREKGLELTFKKDNVKVDIFLFYPKENKRWHGAYYAEKLVPHVFTKKLIENLRVIEFCGHEFNVPSDSEAYLEARYGEDWRIPNGNWRYWLDPKCIIKDFI